MSLRLYRHLSFMFLALASLPYAASGDDPPKQDKPSEARRSKAFEPIELQVSPSPAPLPALKYRLFPIESERTDGDAAPIYLRIGLMLKDAARTQILEKSTAWLDLPADKFPAAEARKFVDQWTTRLEQISFGARRKTCNWSYTLAEQRENMIEILLPDAQDLRLWIRLLAVKARVEIAENKYDDAIRTIETGLAFGRHVGEGPFLISTLVGVAFETHMLTELDRLVSRPDAPNLYWALSALPSPLIPIRMAMENEQKLGEYLVPEMTDLERPRTEAEWSSLLARLHSRLMRLQKTTFYPGGVATQVGKDVTLDQFRTAGLSEAKTFFETHHRSSQGMTPDQMIVLSIAGRYHELRDEWFKLYYLPYSEAAPFVREMARQSKAYETGQVAIFPALLPSVHAAKLAAVQIDRKVAALRVVEAIRMHMAVNAGGLPRSLADIKLVPLPLDPMTGKPFEYNLVGDTATLSGPPPSPDQPGFTYRITLKK
jgi:hypothetical protein